AFAQNFTPSSSERNPVGAPPSGVDPSGIVIASSDVSGTEPSIGTVRPSKTVHAPAVIVAIATNPISESHARTLMDFPTDWTAARLQSRSPGRPGRPSSQDRSR